MTPEQAQALVRWNLRHGNEATTGRALAMVGDEPESEQDRTVDEPDQPPALSPAARARLIAAGLGGMRFLPR